MYNKYYNFIVIQGVCMEISNFKDYASKVLESSFTPISDAQNERQIEERVKVVYQRVKDAGGGDVGSLKDPIIKDLKGRIEELNAKSNYSTTDKIKMFFSSKSAVAAMHMEKAMYAQKAAYLKKMVAIIPKIFSPQYAEGGELQGLKGLEAPLADRPGRITGKQGVKDGEDGHGLLTSTYGEHGKQVVTRDSVVETSIEISKKMIQQLKAQIKKEVDPEKRAVLEKELVFHQTQFLNATSHEHDWLNANYFRDSVKKNGLDKASKNYIAAPPNTRFQELQKPDGTRVVGYVRTGVISDMRNGYVSMKELTEMSKDYDALMTKLEGLRKMQKGSFFKKGDSSDSLKAAIKQLETIEKSFIEKFSTDKDKTALNETLTQLRKKYGNDSQHPTIKKLERYAVLVDAFNNSNTPLPAASSVAKKEVEGIVRDRERVLEHQMMVYIMSQLKNNEAHVKDALKNGTPIEISHVALLNMKQDRNVNKHWRHNERVEMEDMSAIFQKFQGKNLIFDGTGPRMDGNDIYLPMKLAAPNGNNRAELRTNFFNVSVQGDVANTGAQFENNQAAVKKLDQENPGFFAGDDGKAIKKKLENRSEDTSYALAEDLLMHMNKKNQLVSYGCLSAKDRSGVLGESVIQKALPKEAQGKFKDKFFGEEGIPAKISDQNTPGYTATKAKLPAALEGRGFTDTEKVAIYARAAWINVTVKGDL